MRSKHFPSLRLLLATTWLCAGFVAPGCTPTIQVDPAASERFDQASKQMQEAASELKAATQELQEARKALEQARTRPARPSLPHTPPTTSTDTQPGRVFEGIEDAVTCSNETTCTVKKDFIEVMLADHSKLSRQARIVPAIRDGQTLDLKLYGIRSTSVARALHFKNGDLVTQINGHEVGSLSSVLEIYGKLRTATKLEVKIERKGVQRMLNISII
ncbi:MAG: PDZ domain-containing protein [Nannocystaceae bacterium]